MRIPRTHGAGSPLILGTITVTYSPYTRGLLNAVRSAITLTEVSSIHVGMARCLASPSLSACTVPLYM